MFTKSHHDSILCCPWMMLKVDADLTFLLLISEINYRHLGFFKTMSPKSSETLKPAVCHLWTSGIVLAVSLQLSDLAQASPLSALMMIVKAQCPGSLGP